MFFKSITKIGFILIYSLVIESGLDADFRPTHSTEEQERREKT